MTRHEPYPTPQPAHEVRVGDNDTIVIEPSIGFEALRLSGLDSLRIDWAVQDLGEEGKSTVLARRADEIGVTTQEAAIRLGIGLSRATGTSAAVYPRIA